MEKKKGVNRKTRTGTVQYSSRSVRNRDGVFAWETKEVLFPRISMAGNWLEELGFHIGDKLRVECGDGWLHISHKDRTMPQPSAVCEREVVYGALDFAAVADDAGENRAEGRG